MKKIVFTLVLVFSFSLFEGLALADRKVEPRIGDESSKDWTLESKLFEAVITNNLKKVKELFEVDFKGKEVDLNALKLGGYIYESGELKDDSGKPLIYYAAKNENFNMVRFLVGKGAKVNWRCMVADFLKEDMKGSASALISAGAYRGRAVACVGMWSYSVEGYKKITAEQIKTIEYLLEEGADIDGTYKGLNALHYAAMKGNEGYYLVKFLIEKDANYSTRGSRVMPVHLCKNCNPAIIDLLNGDYNYCRRGDY